MLNVNNNRDYISRPQFWMAWGQRSGWHYILSLSVLFPTTTMDNHQVTNMLKKKEKKHKLLLYIQIVWLWCAVYVVWCSTFCCRYDPAEMLCAVFWENSYSDMSLYILCAFSVCVFLPFLLITSCCLLRASGCGPAPTRWFTSSVKSPVCLQWVADQRQIYLSDTLVWDVFMYWSMWASTCKKNKIIITLAKITKVIFYRNYVRTNET